MSMFYRTYWVQVEPHQWQCIHKQDLEDKPWSLWKRWYVSLKYWSRLQESIHYGPGYISWIKQETPFQKWIKEHQ